MAAQRAPTAHIPPPTRPVGRASISRLIGTALFVLLCTLLVDVVLEGWLVTLFGHRYLVNGVGVVDAAGWPKTIKTLLYAALAVLTAAKLTVDRGWGRLRTRADLALLALGFVLLLAGIFGPSEPKLIGEALFVYFRGAIVFYAIRAFNPGPDRIRRVLWVLGILMGVEVLVAVVQFLIGPAAYQAVGWVDLTWANINRAQALLDHPNDLGHFAGLILLGLLALLAVREKVGRWLWAAVVATAFALAAAQSRESILAVLAGLLLIYVLRRAHGRRFAAVAVVIILAASVPILSKGSRAEWQRRLAGVTAAVNMPSGAECTTAHAADPTTNCTMADREIRLLYYQQGEKLLVRRPVLGYGIGQFGGIVAYQNNPNWNEDPRFQPVGFNKYNFDAKTVDAFWLHLVVEAGLLGLIAYLVWLWFLAAPLVRELRPRRGEPRKPRAPGHPALYWAPAAILFVTLVAWLSASLEDPLVPPLLFTIVGIAWVVLARGNQAAPISRSGPRHAASGRHAGRQSSSDGA